MSKQSNELLRSMPATNANSLANSAATMLSSFSPGGSQLNTDPIHVEFTITAKWTNKELNSPITPVAFRINFGMDSALGKCQFECNFFSSPRMSDKIQLNRFNWFKEIVLMQNGKETENGLNIVVFPNCKFSGSLQPLCVEMTRNDATGGIVTSKHEEGTRVFLHKYIRLNFNQQYKIKFIFPFNEELMEALNLKKINTKMTYNTKSKKPPSMVKFPTDPNYIIKETFEFKDFSVKHFQERFHLRLVREIEKTKQSVKKMSIKKFHAGESVTLPTRAEGDCAFHALLGEWNEVSEFIETHNITEKRRQVAEAIVKVKEDSLMFPLIVDAIQDMLMSEGTSFKALRAAYQKNLLDNQRSIAEVWNKLEFSLNSNKEIAEYIAKNVKNKNYLINFNQQFQHCLNLEGGTLFGLILSVEHLDNLLNEYRLKVNATFNLHENILKNPTVLKEYADHLQKPGQYLLPCELNMLAIIFNIKVDYRTYNRNLKNYTDSEILNPNGLISVGVCFNGFGHFERINLYRLNNQNNAPIGKTLKRSNKVGKLPVNDLGSVKRLKTNAGQSVSSHLASAESVAISEISSSATATNASAAVCKPVVLFHKISPTSPSLPKVVLGGANPVVKQSQTFEICNNIMPAPSSDKGYKL